MRYIISVRVVLDTSVLVAALRSPKGASRRLVQEALEQRYELLISVALVLEYEVVLTRPEHLAKSGLDFHEANELLDALVKVAAPVRLTFMWRPALRDPDDDMVLEVAVNGNADVLVTFNLRDFKQVSEGFGVAVLSPGEALRKVKTL
jgi:putative PIN family toxin of toxin-antitoxin system